jgi:hypothetical protein
MGAELFELELTQGPALALHERALDHIEQRYPWQSLNPDKYPALLVERARVGWTENAFNEFSTAAAMGQLIQTLGQARVPVDLWSLACRFPLEELLHVELCSRVAMRLGGGAPMGYDPAHLQIELDPSLTYLERANELIIRLCCVGEAISFALLSGCMNSASHPLTKAVLTTIVQDEALHGRLGFLYLDWVGPELSLSERSRLGQIAAQTLAEYTPLWERLHSTVVDGVTSEGFLIEHVNEMGWMESQRYGELARKSVDRCVRGPLAKHGIRVE